MQRILHIGLAQYEVSRGDPESNLERIESFVIEAKESKVEVLFLPEMATTGFDWAANRRLLPEANKYIERLCAIAKRHAISICGSMLAQSATSLPFNRLIYINTEGVVCAHYDKVHLFSLFHEARHVEAGDRIQTIDTGLGILGCSICYDLRFPELFRACMRAGAEIQVLPAAFPHPRLSHWRHLIIARAIENQFFMVAINQCGTEEHGEGVGAVEYFGHSMVVDPWGEVLLDAGEAPGLYRCEIDLGMVASVRTSLSAIKDRREDVYKSAD